MLILTFAIIAIIVGAYGIGDRVLKWTDPTSELIDGARFIVAAWVGLIFIGSALLRASSITPIGLGAIIVILAAGYISLSWEAWRARNNGRPWISHFPAGAALAITATGIVR